MRRARRFKLHLDLIHLSMQCFSAFFVCTWYSFTLLLKINMNRATISTDTFCVPHSRIYTVSSSQYKQIKVVKTDNRVNVQSYPGMYSPRLHTIVIAVKEFLQSHDLSLWPSFCNLPCKVKWRSQQEVGSHGSVRFSLNEPCGLRLTTALRSTCHWHGFPTYKSIT